MTLDKSLTAVSFVSLRRALRQPGLLSRATTSNSCRKKYRAFETVFRQHPISQVSRKAGYSSSSFYRSLVPTSPPTILPLISSCQTSIYHSRYHHYNLHEVYNHLVEHQHTTLINFGIFLQLIR